MEKVTGRARYTTDVRLDGQLEGVIVRSPHGARPRHRGDGGRRPRGRPAAARPDRPLRRPADRRRRRPHAPAEALAAAERRRRSTTTCCRPRSTDGRPAAPVVYDEHDRKQAPSSSEGLRVARPAGTATCAGPFARASWRGRTAVKRIRGRARGRRPPPGDRHVHHRRAGPHPAGAARLRGPLGHAAATSTWTCPPRPSAWSPSRPPSGSEAAPRSRCTSSPSTSAAASVRRRADRRDVAAVELARRLRRAGPRGAEPGRGAHRRRQPARHPDHARHAHRRRRETSPRSPWTCTATAGCPSGRPSPRWPGSCTARRPGGCATSTCHHRPPGTPFRGPGGAADAVGAGAGRGRGRPPPRRGPHRAAPPLGRQPQAARPLRLGRRAARVGGRPAAGSQTGRFRRGVGRGRRQLALLPRPRHARSSSPSRAGVVVARTATQDMGTGLRGPSSPRIVAEELGLPAERVRVEIGRTGTVHGPTSGGSRTTTSIAPAARDAADACATRWPRRRGRRWLDRSAHRGSGRRQAPPRPPRLRHPDRGGRHGDRPGLHRRRPRHRGRGRHPPRPVTRRCACGAASPSATSTAERLARSQCEGGIIQGIGYALYEERHADPVTGIVLTDNLEDYRIPGIGDTPEIDRPLPPGRAGSTSTAAASASARSPRSAWPPRSATPSTTPPAGAPTTCRSGPTGSWKDCAREPAPHSRRGRGRRSRQRRGAARRRHRHHRPPARRSHSRRRPSRSPRLPALRGITRRADGTTRIGALTSVAELAADPGLRADYPALTMTAGALATPQIRAAGTLGGNLLQRNRCWYYRNPHFSCYRDGGDGCPARTGIHLHAAVVFRVEAPARAPRSRGRAQW